MTGRTPGNGLWQGASAAAVGGAVAVVAVLALGNNSSLSKPPAGQSAPYNLYTHCGISEARVGNQYFLAVHPPGDGAGNPPVGWGNPYQAGTMTLVSATEAVFTDNVGHRVVFKIRPGAKAFLRVCS